MKEKNKITNKITAKNSKLIKFPNLMTEEEASFKALPHRTVEWLGGVNHENLERVISEFKHLMITSPNEEIHLLVNSSGGATGIGMSFYDAVTGWLKPKLVTIGSGDVDSSGIIIFLAGEKRYVTRNTTIFFHLAGRIFSSDKRFSSADMEIMLKEDTTKNYQYASVVAGRTGGKYSPEDIMSLMTNNTHITPQEAVQMGLAHEILG